MDIDNHTIQIGDGKEVRLDGRSVLRAENKGSKPTIKVSKHTPTVFSSGICLF